eukprot:6088943-Pyramimonas_sp.AAC.1
MSTSSSSPPLSSSSFTFRVGGTGRKAFAIWIMRGHPAITVKRCLAGAVGVMAYGMLCAGPPDTMIGNGFRQGWWGWH